MPLPSPFKSLVKSKKQCICSYILFTSVSLNKENGQHSTTSDLQKQDFLMAQSNTNQIGVLAAWPFERMLHHPICFHHPNFSYEKEVLKNGSLCLEAKHCIHSRTPLCNFFSVRFDNWILLFASCGCVATRNKKMNKSWALPQGDHECEPIDAKINSAQDLLGILKLPLMGQIIAGRCYWSLMSEASGERRRKHLFPT